MPPSTVASDRDVRISRMPLTSVLIGRPQAIQCHVKFYQWKIRLRCGLSSKFFDHLFFITDICEARDRLTAASMLILMTWNTWTTIVRHH